MFHSNVLFTRAPFPLYHPSITPLFLSRPPLFSTCSCPFPKTFVWGTFFPLLTAFSFGLRGNVPVSDFSPFDYLCPVWGFSPPPAQRRLVAFRNPSSRLLRSIPFSARSFPFPLFMKFGLKTFAATLLALSNSCFEFRGRISGSQACFGRLPRCEVVSVCNPSRLIFTVLFAAFLYFPTRAGMSTCYP